MSEQVGSKLSAALRAQASGLGTGSPGAPTPAAAPGHGRTPAKSRLPAFAIVALAALLGAMAGGLAGVISTW